MKHDNNIAHFNQSINISSDREERFFQRQRFDEATAKDEQIVALEALADTGIRVVDLPARTLSVDQVRVTVPQAQFCLRCPHDSHM